MKKMLSLLLASAMSLSLLAGCGGAPQTPPAQSNPPANASSQGDASTPETPAGPIKVAALSSGYETAYPGMWQEVCDAFTAETGIEVQLTLEKNLEDVIGPSMQGGDYPDVVLCATNPYGDGKTYLAPMFYAPCGLFYNAGLFQEKGWEVPKTWDEMWALGDKAKAEDIWLFTYPTTGYFDAFLYALMYSVGGPDFFNKATSYAEGVWDTPEGQQCFDIIAKLAEYTNPVTPAQANETDFSQNQQLILDNKALFCPNGTWLPGEMDDAPRADGFEWGMCALPAAKAGGQGASYAFLEQIWIPSGAANIDAAKQFIAYMYSDKAIDIFLKGGAVQPVNGITSKLEGENLMYYSVYDNGANPVVGIFSAYESVAGLGTVREVFLDPVNALVSGQLTRDQWVSDIKAASDQMRANLVVK